MKKRGIQLDNNGDLLIRNGALQIGDTLYQNQYMILSAQKGEIKHSPTLGVGLSDMLHDDDILTWKKTIREEFAKDGLVVSELEITTNTMTLKADYNG